MLSNNNNNNGDDDNDDDDDKNCNAQYLYSLQNFTHGLLTIDDHLFYLKCTIFISINLLKSVV